MLGARELPFTHSFVRSTHPVGHLLCVCQEGSEPEECAKGRELQEVRTKRKRDLVSHSEEPGSPLAACLCRRARACPRPYKAW
ncbi:hypothetical protein VULLAG_LOCUS4053 [Vulpes lagopus]